MGIGIKFELGTGIGMAMCTGSETWVGAKIWWRLRLGFTWDLDGDEEGKNMMIGFKMEIGIKNWMKIGIRIETCMEIERVMEFV